MTNLSLTVFENMTVTCMEETEGGATITFDWDDTDPGLEPWRQMSEPEKRSYMYNAFSNRLQGNLDVAS